MQSSSLGQNWRPYLDLVELLGDGREALGLLGGGPRGSLVVERAVVGGANAEGGQERHKGGKGTGT